MRICRTGIQFLLFTVRALTLFCTCSAKDHDAVFWLGDLNYRIDSSVAALDVLHHALSRQLAFLAENDQLNRAREAGDAFEGFHEGKMERWLYRETLGGFS